MAGLSQRGYARHRGVTHRAVQKAIKAGRITTNSDGTIDAARADAQWTANTDPASATRYELDEENEQSPHGADVAAGNGGVVGARPASRRPTAPGWMQPIIWLLKKLIMITPEKAAKSIVHLALSAEVEGKTGLYFNQLKPKEPSKLALDDDLAERLWAESARLVKL